MVPGTRPTTIYHPLRYAHSWLLLTFSILLPLITFKAIQAAVYHQPSALTAILTGLAILAAWGGVALRAKTCRTVRVFPGGPLVIAPLFRRKRVLEAADVIGTYRIPFRRRGGQFMGSRTAWDAYVLTRAGERILLAPDLEDLDARRTLNSITRYTDIPLLDGEPP